MPEVTSTTTEVVKPAATTKPMSDKDFLAARIAKLTGKPAPEPTSANPEPASKQSESSPEAKSQEAAPAAKAEDAKPPEAKPKDVLSKDVDELTDEEIAELAQKGKSGLLKRIAELTARRKMAEEKAANMEAALQRQLQQIPAAKVENNPYASIDTVDKLQSEQGELNSFIEWAEDVLAKSEDSSSIDVVANSDGKEYTKADIRDTLRGARKRRDKFLPAQFFELQARQQRVLIEESFRHQARKELSWLDGEDNDTRKNFEAMIKDPRLKKLKESVPDLAPQVEYLIAHAANSIYGRRTIVDSAQKTPTITPPENPASSNAAPGRQEMRGSKTEADLKDRLRMTGKGKDFIALRAAQLSKRK